MAFDIIGAKQEGYSDAEIADELARRAGFNVSGARAEGYSDQEIIGHLSSKVAIGGKSEVPTFKDTTKEPVSTIDIASPNDRSIAQRAPGFIKDTAIDAVKGVVGLGESAVGLADIATGNLAGEGLSAVGYDPKKTDEILSSGYSLERKAANTEVQSAKGFMGTLGALVDNPSVAFGSIVESAPMSLGSAAIARSVAVRMLANAGIKAGTSAATQFFANPKVQTALIAASAGSEGAMTAGNIQEQGRQGGRDWSDTVAPAVGAGLITSTIGFGTSKIPGLRDAEVSLATAGIGGAGANSILAAGKAIAKSMFKEGALEEMPQSAQEQIFTNLAMGKPWKEGVPEAAATGLVVGAAQGGGMTAGSEIINNKDAILNRNKDAIAEGREYDQDATSAAVARIRSRLEQMRVKKDVPIPDTGIQDSNVTVDDAIQAASAEVDIPDTAFAGMMQDLGISDEEIDGTAPGSSPVEQEVNTLEVAPSLPVAPQGVSLTDLPRVDNRELGSQLNVVSAETVLESAPAFPHQADIHAEDLAKKLEAGGIAPDSPLHSEIVGERRQRERAPDPTTGLIAREHYSPTINRAWRDHQDSGRDFSYASIDIANLGGLNTFSGGESKADVHVAAIAKIIQSQVEQDHPGAQVFRRGGDEFAVVAPDVSQEDLEASIANAKKSVTVYAEKEGLANIPHKTAGKPPGVGIEYGVADFKQNSTVKDVEQVADSVMAAKREAKNVTGRRIEAAELAPPQRQTGGVENSSSGESEADQEIKLSPLAQKAKVIRASKPPTKINASKHDLLQAIAYLGGLNLENAVDQWGSHAKDAAKDKALNNRVFGKPVFRVNGGLNVDRMAEALIQDGYLVADGHGKHNIKDLEEKIIRAIGGDRIYSNQYEAPEPIPDFDEVEIQAHDDIIEVVEESADDGESAMDFFENLIAERGGDNGRSAENESKSDFEPAAEAKPDEGVEASQGDPGGETSTDEVNQEPTNDIPSVDDFERMLDEAADNPKKTVTLYHGGTVVINGDGLHPTYKGVDFLTDSPEFAKLFADRRPGMGAVGDDLPTKGKIWEVTVPGAWVREFVPEPVEVSGTSKGMSRGELKILKSLGASVYALTDNAPIDSQNRNHIPLVNIKEHALDDAAGSEKIDESGWKQDVAVKADKKPLTIGGVQKQGGTRQSTADLLDAFTPEPAGLFDAPAISPQSVLAESDIAKRAKEQYAGWKGNEKPASMQDHISKAIDAGADALNEIFSSVADPNKLNSGLSFDDEAYQKAKPHLQKMWDEIRAAGFSFKEAAQAFAKQLIEKFGAKIKPYALKFYSELAAKETGGTDNVERISDNLERDSEDAAAQDGMGEEDVQPRPGGDDRLSLQSVQDSSQEAFEPGRDSVLPRSETASSGERSDKPVRGEEAGLEGRPAGSDDDQRISDNRDDGPPAESVTAKAVAKAVERTIPEERNNDSVDKDLPILHPGQRDDVRFAEARFSKPDGYGVMFTNGTGTGKTFSGLGIAKRFTLQGKNNIIILAPNQDIINSWIRSGKLLHLNITKLEDTKDAGKGPVITTYANFGQNSALINRKWDLVITDEADNLSSNKDGNPSLAANMLQALTLHPDGVHQRVELLHPELAEQRKKIYAQLNEARKLKLPTESLDKKANDLEQKWQSARDKVKADVEASQNETRPRVVFLSATPFAYEKSIDYAEGYLFSYGPKVDSGRYNPGNAYERFMMQHFGYRMRYNKLTEPPAEVDRGIMQRQFNTWLKKAGVLSGRMLDVESDYDRKFVLIDSAIGNKIDEGLEFVRNHPEYKVLEQKINGKFDHLSRRYLLEAIKADAVTPLIKEHHDLGRQVVVFHDFNKGGGFNPFDLSSLVQSQELVSIGTYPDTKSVELGPIVQRFLSERPDLAKMPLASLQAPLVALKKAFPDILVINGTETPKNRKAAIEAFQDDNDPHKLILVQSDAGKAGISLHDTTGNSQRVTFNLGLPTKPVTSIQQEGRTYRIGQASNAMFRYINTGTNWERYAFATTIANRTSAAENLALGESARALRDAFIEGFQESDSYPAGFEGEGTGGKERDRLANSALTEWDRATAFYFGQRKGRQNDLGADYFATPEPLGLKMVEWAGVRTGDSVLEPSGGHGAIARWFPEDAKRRAIEPSLELASRLALVFDGDVIQGQFEDHNIINKYDAVVMNPPFGSGGRTAVDHIAKAAKHLKENGRIVAIIPTGPAADKKFEKWLYEESVIPVEPAGKIAGQAVYAGDTANYYIKPEEQRRMMLVDPRVKVTITKIVDYSSTELMVFIKMPNGQQFSVPSNLLSNIEPTGKREKKSTTDMQLTASYLLPSVTFERAGTAVAARVVILDKNGTAQQVNQDWRQDGLGIKTFFNRIENASVPERQRTAAVEEPVKKEVPKVDGVVSAQFNHTKTGKPIFVATINRKLDDADYKAANSLAKQHGGRYSGFNGAGAIRGFHFDTADKRDAFVNGLQGVKEDSQFSLDKKHLYGYNNDNTPFKERLNVPVVYARDFQRFGKVNVDHYGVPLTRAEANEARRLGFHDYQVLQAEVGSDVAPVELKYPFRLFVSPQILSHNAGPSITPDQSRFRRDFLGEESRFQQAFDQAEDSPYFSMFDGGTLNKEAIQKVEALIAQALPTGKVTVNIVPEIKYMGQDAGAAFAAHGVTEGKISGVHQLQKNLATGEVKSIITLAIDGATDKVGYHEVLHGAEALGLFSLKDIQILEREFPDKEGIASGERRADAFADFIENGTKPKGYSAILFGRVKTFLDKLKRLMQLKGWRTADDVFSDLMSGKLKRNAQGVVSPAAGVQFAAAWHGSPHDFDKFQSHAIGTGEGAQAYGHGLYFAGSKDVAEFYKKALSERDIRIDGKRSFEWGVTDTAKELIYRYGGDVDAAITEAKSLQKESKSLSIRTIAYQAEQELAELKGRNAVTINKGKLYQVELAPAEDEYLLWDKPLSEQSEKVKAAWEKIFNNPPENVSSLQWKTKLFEARWLDAKTENAMMGAYTYDAIGKLLGSEGAASEYLHSLGIRGIKYLDGTSRGKGEGNYNYVIFNDEDVTISAKFSLAKGEKFTSASEEVQARRDAAHGLAKGPGLLDRLKETMARALKETQHFPELDMKRDAQTADILRVFESSRQAATAKTVAYLKQLTGDMTAEEMNNFEWRVLLDDLMEESGKGHDLPFGYDAETLEADHARIVELTDGNEKIKAAIEKRQKSQQAIVKELVDNGMLPETVLDSKSYFRHMVLEYANAKKWAGLGNKELRNKKRGWQKGRQGSELDINTNFLEAEFEVYSQQLKELATKEALDKVAKINDVSKKLKREAKATNFENLVGGADVVKRIRSLEAEAADLRSGEIDNGVKAQLAAITQELDELDPTRPFKRSMAIGFGKLERLAKRGDLPEGKIKGMAEALANGEPTEKLFNYIAYLAGTEKEGASLPARQILKAIADLDKLHRTTLGGEYLEHRRMVDQRLIPEGYVEWQPEKGNAFHRETTLPEQIVDKAIAATWSVEELVQSGLLKEQAVLMGKKPSIVIPEGVALTLDNLRFERDTAVLDNINKKMVGAWKIWTLLSPRRVLKYNLNNMSGDVDVALAADPKILKYMKESWDNALLRRKGQLSADDIDMLDRGVLDSGISINEIPDINQLPMFKGMTDDQRHQKIWTALSNGDLSALGPVNLITKYFDKISALTNIREGLLREAAYRRALELLKEGKPVMWASKPDEIKAIPDMKDKAAKLARELIGDYGNISAHGEKIRARYLPFWSWMEINTPRYYRIFKNAAEEKGKYSTGARIVGVAGKKMIGTTAGVMEKVVLTQMLFALVTAFNHLVHGDDDDDLSQKQLHLIMGKDSDGKIMSVRFQGAFSDALSWFGLEDYPETFRKLDDGSMSAGDLAGKMAMATPNKLINSALPFVKLAGETLVKKTLYPDVTKPRAIRDRGEHIARFLSLDNEYRAVAGKPTRGYLDSIKGILFYTTDPKEAAYNEIRGQAIKWMEKQGKEMPGGEPTARSNALYYYKQAKRFNDDEAAAKYKAQYKELGGKQQGMMTSIKNAAPLHMTGKHSMKFKASLTPAEKRKLEMAVDFYKSTYWKN